MAYRKEEETFTAFLDDVTVKGAIGMGIGLGSKLKIFDIMAGLGPKTYTEIAEAGKWKSRYVKEWLNLMVSGHIIEYIKETEQYYIPDDREKYLVTSGKTENRSIFLQSLPICGLVTDELRDCFALDGPKGTAYSSYTGFHEWRNERTQARFHWDGRTGLKNVLALVPSLLQQLEKGIRVCDGGSSTGHQVMILAENLPNSTFIGFDISEHSVELAQQICQQRQLSNVTFQAEDACNMPVDWTNTFELFTVFDVVHDVPEPEKMLKEVYRVLKPGGMFLMMDINLRTRVEDNIGNGASPVIYFMSLFHCMPVSLYGKNGRGLGAAWGIEAQREYLTEAGFRDIKMLPTEDKMHSYFAAFK